MSYPQFGTHRERLSPLIRLIEEFVTELRKRGLRVSPAEGIEASRATLAVGIESREEFRIALQATLSKSRDDRKLFEEAFQSYFSLPRPGRIPRRGEGGVAAGGGRGGKGPGGGRPEAAPRAAAAKEPSAGRRPSRTVPIGSSKPAPTDVRRTARSRPGLRGAQQSKEATPVRRPPRLILSEAGPGPSAEKERDAGAEHRGATDPRRLTFRGRLASEEEALLAREIPALIREIRLRRGRRFRRGPRGRLWTKRMMRESLAHGGVPFVLPMKERRPRRPRVVLLVDVSFSVARAAGYFLQICRGLTERLSRTEIYFFVDRVVEATSAVRSWSDRPAPGLPFDDLLRSIPDLNLGAPSDYGRVFFQARPVLSRSTGRSALLVVLGDARSNHREPLGWAFEDLAARCRRVLWLNPEPRDLWDTADSVMGTYLPACDVVCEARDLQGLTRGVREIMRSL
jgi:uncharacterized protein with von Willebrand factor type A (vWA) domain